MPNHITTEVRIDGTKEQIAKLIEDTKIKTEVDLETNEFDFNGIVKMPPELLLTVSPCDVVETQEEADKLNEEYNKHPFLSADKEQVKAITKAEQERRIKEYGAVDWYSWSNANWGTKWNAYDVCYIDHTETSLVLKLQTAWDTPREIWVALEAQGFIVRGVIYGEMEGYKYIGDGNEVFEAYQTVEVDYVG